MASDGLTSPALSGRGKLIHGSDRKADRIQFQEPGTAQRSPDSQVVHDRTGQTSHNERFEFLGDSVPGLIVSYYLLRKTPSQDEAISQGQVRPGLAREPRALGRQP